MSTTPRHVPPLPRAIAPELRIRDAAVDELHVHQTRQVLDALKTAPAARRAGVPEGPDRRREGDR